MTAISKLLDCADTSVSFTLSSRIVFPPDMTSSKRGATELNAFEINQKLTHDLILLIQSLNDDIRCDGYVSSEECFKVADLACDISLLRRKLSKMTREGQLFSGVRQWKTLRNWLKVRSKDEDFISIYIPVRNDERKNKYAIQYRKNSGEDIHIDIKNLNECICLIRKLKNLSNYMICLDENGERVKRWDREIFSRSHRWNACNPDGLEIVGKLPVICKM